MSKTKKWALWGAAIGLVVGVIEMVGVTHCHWNPVEGGVVIKTYFCDNFSFLYLLGVIPDMVFQMLPDFLGISLSLESYMLFVYPVLMSVFFILLGSLIAVLVSKLIKKK